MRFREEIRVEWLIDGFPPASDPSDVLMETYLHRSPHVLSAVVYARAETRFGYLVFKSDGRSIRLHVEGRAQKGDLRELVRQSERIADALISQGRSHGARLEGAAITLYADEFLITNGTHQSFAGRLMKRFAETIFGDVVVGVFTGVLTGVLTRQWDAAIVVGLASVLCFVAWLVLEIQGERDAYEYAKL